MDDLRERALNDITPTRHGEIIRSGISADASQDNRQFAAVSLGWLLRRLSEMERVLREARTIGQILESRFEVGDVDYPEVFETRLRTFLRELTALRLTPDPLIKARGES